MLDPEKCLQSFMLLSIIIWYCTKCCFYYVNSIKYIQTTSNGDLTSILLRRRRCCFLTQLNTNNEIKYKLRLDYYCLKVSRSVIISKSACVKYTNHHDHVQVHKITIEIWQ